MEDHRIALPYGALLPLSAKEHIQIKEEIGRGASCLVYDAVYQDSIGIPHTIRLKECYPVSLAVSRNSEGDLTVEKEEEERGEEGKEKRKEKEEARLEQAKERFLKTYERNVALRNTLGLINSTSNPTDLLFFHNTVYLRVAMEEGEDYRSYQDRSLKELFLHTKSLTELIGKYHRNGYLHLDIKPENIFLLPETEEHVVLFDVDSVIRIEDLAGKEELWSRCRGTGRKSGCTRIFMPSAHWCLRSCSAGHPVKRREDWQAITALSRCAMQRSHIRRDFIGLWSIFSVKHFLLPQLPGGSLLSRFWHS